MKRALILFILFVGIYSLKAQKILSDSVLVSGFYQSITEFTDNSPSIPFDYEIIEKIIRVSSYTSKTSVYRVKINKSSAKQLSEVIGFSNGKHVYFKADANKYRGFKIKRKFNANTNFLKVKDLGTYTYFEDIQTKPSAMTTFAPRPEMGGGMGVQHIGGGTTSIKPCIINTQTGERIMLTSKEMKKLLADEPHLLEDFEKDKYRNDSFSKYIFRYNERKRGKKNLR